MDKKGNPFLDILPSIDIHGYTRDTMFTPVDIFINDNIKLRNKKIVVIHGVGLSILKNELFRRFKKDRRVLNMYISSDNSGCTILELNI